MATKTYKLIDLFRSFYILFTTNPTLGSRPNEESNLDELVNLLSAQLIIIKLDKIPEDISTSMQDFFQRFFRILYFDRNAVRYVCEKVVQFQKDRTLVDREDKVLHSHIRKIINQLSSDETIEIDTKKVFEDICILTIKKKPSYKIAIPWALEKRFLGFFQNILENEGYYLSGVSLPMESGKCGFIIENVKEDEEDKLYSLLEKFAREYNLSVTPRANEKLTFGDLKTGDIFIQFPIAKNNGFLIENPSFMKIEEDAEGNNAERANSTSRNHFLPSVLILKIS